MSACRECGFDPDATDSGAAIAGLRGLPPHFVASVTRFLPGEDAAALLRARPSPEVWSALEYVAHTRDAIEWYRQRIERVLTEDRPQLSATGWSADGYAQEDPPETAAGLGRVAVALAERVAAVSADDWARTGVGSDGGDRTVLDLARRAVHEGHHHLLDVGRSLRAARQR